MKIIPVLDIKGGQVVRAEGGRRDRYLPISTPLSPDSDPVSVANGLRSLHPFSTFYIADLDAIEGRASNREALEKLVDMPSSPELWVDAGFSIEEDVAEALKRPRTRPVIGSESQQDERLLRRFCRHPDIILSLDFFGEGFRGPPVLLSDTTFWPDTVIVMTLAKVGSGSGPDFSRLSEVKSRASDRAIIAAGGIRHEDDLRQLAQLGIAGALVATALHGGALSPSQLVGLDRQ